MITPSKHSVSIFISLFIGWFCLCKIYLLFLSDPILLQYAYNDDRELNTYFFGQIIGYILKLFSSLIQAAPHIILVMPLILSIYWISNRVLKIESSKFITKYLPIIFLLSIVLWAHLISKDFQDIKTAPFYNSINLTNQNFQKLISQNPEISNDIGKLEKIRLSPEYIIKPYIAANFDGWDDQNIVWRLHGQRSQPLIFACTGGSFKVISNETYYYFDRPQPDNQYIVFWPESQKVKLLYDKSYIEVIDDEDDVAKRCLAYALQENNNHYIKRNLSNLLEWSNFSMFSRAWIEKN